MSSTDHAVVDGHLTTAEAYDIDGVAALVVVPIVFLYCRETDRIFLLDAEHRVSEGVFGHHDRGCVFGQVGLCRHLIDQWHGHLVASEVACDIGLIAEETEIRQSELLVGQLCRCVVDTIVDGIVSHPDLVHDLFTCKGCPVAFE